jgi:hypothetical protein
VAARLGDPALAASAQAAYLHGMTLVLLACAAIVTLGTVLAAAFLPGQMARQDRTEAPNLPPLVEGPVVELARRKPGSPPPADTAAPPAAGLATAPPMPAHPQCEVSLVLGAMRPRMVPSLASSGTPGRLDRGGRKN